MLKAGFPNRALDAGRLRVAMAIVLALSLSGCNLLSPDGAGDCGNEFPNTTFIYTPFESPWPDTNGIDGGRAIFAWSEELRDLCSQASHSDTNVFVQVFTDMAISPPPGLTMEGRVYHAPGIRPYSALVAFQSGPKPGEAAWNFWEGAVENIGLKQGNPDGGAATIINELVVSFTSSGNFSFDRATAERFIRQIKFVSRYRLAK